MKTIALFGLLTAGLASPAIAATNQAQAQSAAQDVAKQSAAQAGANQSVPQQQTQSAPGAAVQHYDFEDDQVEGDIQRPDGELISSIPKASEQSLIEIRRNFVPEIVKMIEDLQD